MSGIDAELDFDTAGDGAPWWTSRREVAAFAHVLVDAEQLGDCQHMVVSFFETPWAWDAQYAIWCATGRPDMGSPREFDELSRLLDTALS